MLALLGDHPPCLLIEQLFQEHLTEDTHIHLVVAKVEECRELARLADTLWSSRDAQEPYANTIQYRPVARRKAPEGKTPLPFPIRLCAITIRGLEEQPTSADSHALGRKMTRPVVSSGLFILYDTISKRHFLVDTGAEVSVIPANGLDTCGKRSGPLLLAANGSSIRTYETCTLSLRCDSNMYCWNFVIVDVSCSLLGADFLRSNSLLVDLKKKQLVVATTYQSARLCSTRAIVPHLDAISVSNDPYNLLLANFCEITTPNFMESHTRHGLLHFITTKGPPVHAHA